MTEYVIAHKDGTFWGIKNHVVGYHDRECAIVFRWPGKPDEDLPGFRKDRETWQRVDELSSTKGADK